MKLLPLVAGLVFCAGSAFGYTTEGHAWTKDRTVVMQISMAQRDVDFGKLTDGFTFSESAADAFNTWNNYLPHLHFRTVINSSVANAGDDAENSVFFSDTIYGELFGTGVLAVTLRNGRPSGLTEADVIFNQNKPFDSYRGPLQTYRGLPTAYDFHRVALHEFGHVLGLDHPDKANPPQTVTAIMNSIVSDIDSLQQDDIDGAQSLYASGPAYLATASAPDLVNLSTRAFVGSGDNTLIGGFIIQGSQPATVVLRAIGHSLVAFGINNPLLDPVIELHDSTGAQIATNDDWVDDANAQTIASYHLDPVESTESALVATLKPGSYTAVVRGFDNGDGNVTGTGLVELYDLRTNASRAGNISSRAQVFTDANVLIGGFIVGSGPSKPVVVRAIGPSLAAFGVAGALIDPTLELRDASGNLVQANDNWPQGPDAALIQKENLAPTSPSESALQSTLNPGSYTAVVRGANNGTGVGLVEVYDLTTAPN
ncbi:MAG: matrixin family metalloprotease [Verrucomicrobiota bacterium]|nr:matrixin family metalloprotease [Verrucomicrobiota bacterium]